MENNSAAIVLQNFDELFASDPDAKIIPCGQDTVVSKDMMKAQIETFFQDGTRDLMNIASCDCGHLMGNYFQGTDIVCPKCHTHVRTNFADELKFRIWLAIPEELPPLLHPVAYGVLDRWLGSFKKEGRILPTLLNVTVPLPVEYQGVFQQGFKYFHENFWHIINWFATKYKKFQTTKERAKTEKVLEFLNKYKDRLFFRHIPILNSALHMMTQSGTMMFADNVVKHIIKAKLELSTLIYIYRNSTYNATFVDRRMFEIYTSFLDYTNNILNVKLLKKPGFIRKHLLGARMDCTARIVIVPIPGAHQADEVYLPWLAAMQLYQLEILNVLMNRKKLRLPDAVNKMMRAMAAYDPEIHEILNTLIKECPWKGLPLLVGRNPSLRHGAIFLLYATRIKDEFEDVTLSISPLIAPAPNLNLSPQPICGNLVSVMLETAGTTPFELLEKREKLSPKACLATA